MMMSLSNVSRVPQSLQIAMLDKDESSLHKEDMNIGQIVVGYALINQYLMVMHHNTELSHWVKDSAVDLVGRWLDEVFPELLNYEKVLHDLIQGTCQTPLIIPLQHLNANGQTRYYNLQVEPYTRTETIALLATVVDVTETTLLKQKLQRYHRKLYSQMTASKKAEIALQKAHQEMETQVQMRTSELSKTNALLAQALQIKNKLLTTTNKELQTVFDDLLKTINTLSENHSNHLNEQQKAIIRDIEAGSQHVLALINRSFSLTGQGDNQVEAGLTPTMTKKITETCLQLTKQVADKKRIEIFTRLNNTLTLAKVDKHHLRRILFHLLSHAVHATPEEGNMGLEINDDKQQDVVHFTVWHTPTEHAVAETFSHHYHSDDDTTGIKLSLVHYLAEMLSGHVTIAYEPGKKNQLTVSLPTLTESQADMSLLASCG
jgi:signal transduction histidine kinase